MPRSFPDMDSLKRQAPRYDFRQPNEGESEEDYRTALADVALKVDPVESAEIRNKVGWNAQSPEMMLRAMGFKL